MATRPSFTILFSSEQQGWSERYWYSNASATLQQAAPDAAFLIQARALCLARGVRIPFAYLSFDDEFRDVFPTFIPEPDANGVWNAALNTDPDNPNLSIVIRCQSGVRAGKMLYLAGAPDSAINYPPLYNPAPRFTVAFNNAIEPFLQLLRNGKWGWKAISFTAGTNPTANITAMSQTAQTWVLDVDNTTGFTAGSLVKMSGVVYTGATRSQVNRNYRVGLVAPPDGMTLLWGTGNYTGVTYIGGGKVIQGAYSILPITGTIIDKVTSRKRGVGGRRPLGRRRRA